jgi:hypothetical protein
VQRTTGIDVAQGRNLRVLGAIGVLGALAVVSTGGGSAAAETEAAKPGVTKVKMEFVRSDKELLFDAPATVPAGNRSRPRAASCLPRCAAARR